MSGDEQLRKIIMLGLSDCDSANPFQDLGLTPDMVFQNQTPELEARIRRRVQDVFRALESQHRARLTDETLAFERLPATQELVLPIRYLNLETNESADVPVAFGPAGARIVGGP